MAIAEAVWARDALPPWTCRDDQHAPCAFCEAIVPRVPRGTGRARLAHVNVADRTAAGFVIVCRRCHAALRGVVPASRRGITPALLAEVDQALAVVRDPAPLEPTEQDLRDIALLHGDPVPRRYPAHRPTPGATAAGADLRARVAGPRHVRRSADRSPRSVLAALLVAVGVALLVGLVALAAFAVTTWAASPAAAAGGSDSPTPYTLTAAGIDFPVPLEAHGHVNVRTQASGSYSLHLDPNAGHPGARWIGATTLPWTALGVPAGACVAWVQWSGSNAHYGEGGQPAHCLQEDPCPTSSATPTSTAAPTPAPSPVPSTTAAPTPTSTPAPSSSPQPSTEPVATPVPSSTASPTSHPTSQPSVRPSSSPTRPATAPPVATPGGPSSALSPTTATLAPQQHVRAEISVAADDERHDVLAATGPDESLLWWAAAGAVAAIGAGVNAVRLVRDERARRRGGAR